MSPAAGRRAGAGRAAASTAGRRRRGGAVSFLVITGLSGSGKSAAVKALEDQGAWCVDNLPVALLPRMLELARGSRADLGLVVLGMDIRERRFVREFPRVFRAARARGIPIRLLFFEASEEVLVRRYSETRRVHPLGGGLPLIEAIREERRELEPLRALADEVIDTSRTRVRELRERMLGIAREKRAPRELAVTVLSFGFKHGLPADADLVFDVRFIANPFFEEGLRQLSGLDDPVREFVLSRPETASFLAAWLPFLTFLVPLYRVDGRAYLTIAVGCTGGRHRSPVLAREAADALARRGFRVAVRNRDIQAE